MSIERPDFKALYPNLIEYMISTGSIPPKYAMDLSLVNNAMGIERELAKNMEDIADGLREEFHEALAKLETIKTWEKRWGRNITNSIMRAELKKILEARNDSE